MRPEPWGQLWPSRNTRSAVCHPPKDATGPDGPVSPLSSSHGEISAPWRSACPGEEEKVTMSSDTPSIHLGPTLPKPHSSELLPPPCTFTDEGAVSLSSRDGPPSWAGQPRGLAHGSGVSLPGFKSCFCPVLAADLQQVPYPIWASVFSPVKWG